MTQLVRFYQQPALNRWREGQLEEKARSLGIDGLSISSEWCYYLELEESLTEADYELIRWLLAEMFEPDNFGETTFLTGKEVVEIGPHLSFETSWSSNAISVLRDCGLSKAIRIERSLRLGFEPQIEQSQVGALIKGLFDRMTEMIYPVPLSSFATNVETAAVRIVPVLAEGSEVLLRLNEELGLGWDEQDVQYIRQIFQVELERNPSDVELFQLAQSLSEHSRHPFFRGEITIDGQPVGQTLLEIVMRPWKLSPGNSLSAFSDDSSVIRGGLVEILVPEFPGQPSLLVSSNRVLHPTLTAETHSHPTGISPYPGAATGGGGVTRDGFSVGKGALVTAYAFGYAVAALGLGLPGEKKAWPPPEQFARPIDVLIQASNGASDYGNCFGQPVTLGFVRSFDFQLGDNHWAWYKPILYAASAGLVDDLHVYKGDPEVGMLVVQIGGPAYRIGLGGGSASSMMQGQNTAKLDFDSVQRGDPEMEQRVYRVIRACIELGEGNPIVSIHDLGAGGDCNALPELVHPLGARINLRSIPVGDKNLSVLELLGNESQERACLLIRPADRKLLEEICRREGCPVAFLGEVTGDGNFVLEDNDGSRPVELPQEVALGEGFQKHCDLVHLPQELDPLELPEDLTVEVALDKILRLLSVGSKGYLVRKVDRAVGGLIAQQQCVGPFQLPVADFSIEAHSHFGYTGTARSLGEQPIKGLLNPAAMGRLAVAEALLNLCGARVSNRDEIRCQANWMWAAKLPGEGAKLYDTAVAMSNIMVELGLAVDGGKDSLSMATLMQGPEQTDEVVKAPGQLVIATYAYMNDVRIKVTPDLKKEGSFLIFIDLGVGRMRLGGSALAQSFDQIGSDCPDVEDVSLLARVFDTIQEFVEQGLISAVHDRSDGGLITTLVEMAIAGGYGMGIQLQTSDPISFLFNEELGLVVETDSPQIVLARLSESQVPAQLIGEVADRGSRFVISDTNGIVLDNSLSELRVLWESTSTLIEEFQTDPECVAEETASFQKWDPPSFSLTYTPQVTLPEVLQGSAKPKVVVFRDEGSNGDQEMAASFHLAGFDVYDVTTRDLIEGKVQLRDFVGLVAVGGFSRKDVPTAGKGWGAIIRFNPSISEQFKDFFNRPDTFSLGVCNGCQLFTVLGLVPWQGLEDRFLPRFIANRSKRFESRFATVEIRESPSIFFRGMEGSRLGIWVAHGEGQLYLPKQDQLHLLHEQKLIPLGFVDPLGRSTETYPFNPNGSPNGITALCSPNGRHLVMMPHSERLSSQLWQWPWLPEEWKDLLASPWLRLFQNAYDWCRQS
ncbi:phosphoribosylformylglycinamidine synthase [Patescibacteria group bacterium]|nr:phosphoribosylformylglycinamidine synthase [Patescibacteria group bacterium]